MPKGTCSIQGCERPARRREWCSAHYERWRRHGDPIAGGLPAGASVAERFWAKVNRDGPIPAHRPELGPCWVWTGGRTEDGYGRFRWEGQATGAHRVAWLLVNGDLGELSALHHCDNPACVNPGHLFRGNQAANMADCAQKRRIVAHSGERHARARLTDAQVQQVRLRYGAGGITQRALAEEFGVSRSLIAGITLGKLRNAI